jgi:type IV pilus assembly protein PilB
MKAWDSEEVLVRERLITHEQLQKAREVQRTTRQRNLLRVVVDLAFMTETVAGVAQSIFREKVTVDLTGRGIDAAVLGLVPADISRQHQMLALERQGDVLVLATAHVGDIMAEDAVRAATGLDVRWRLADPQQLRDAIARHYEDR